jgi:hypothetical protein
VWLPDALVPGVSPMKEGLGVVEPSMSNRVKSPSNLTRTAPPLVGRGEELSRLGDILREVLAGQPRVVPLAGEAGISTNLQDRAECHYRAGLAHRRDQDAGHRRAHHEEPVKASCPAGNIRTVAEVLAGRTQICLTFAFVPLRTLVDLQSLYQSDTESPPVLRCARS